MVGLPDGEKILRICITIYTQYWHLTDRQTDGQTSCHSIVCAIHTHHAVKTGVEGCGYRPVAHVAAHLREQPR